MSRKRTLFTGQWADLSLDEIARMAVEFGFDGLELAGWGPPSDGAHFDAEKAAGVSLADYIAAKKEGADAVDALLTEGKGASDSYCKGRWAILEARKCNNFATSQHLVGQATLDKIDRRHKGILPGSVWGEGVKGDPGDVGYDPLKALAINARACAYMELAAIGHRRWMDLKPEKLRKAYDWGVEVGVVNGFTGSSIWHLIYDFAPMGDVETTEGIPASKRIQPMIREGYDLLAERWNPVLDVFADVNVRFALEVHPTEIAFDLYTAERALEALNNREEFGFNFDPSHLIWQNVDPVEFIRAFPDRVYHVHDKDALVTNNGRAGILASHFPFGHINRGWDFRSVGRGQINFEAITKALNAIKYSGPRSVEWEDSGMERDKGATESVQHIAKVDYSPSLIKFDGAFGGGDEETTA